MKPASNQAGMIELGSCDSNPVESSHSCQSMRLCRGAGGEASWVTAETEGDGEPTGNRGAEGGAPRSGRTKRPGQGIEADTVHGMTPSAKLLRLLRFDASPEYTPLSGCQSSWLGLGRAARTGRGQSATRARDRRCRKLDLAARLSAVMDGLHRGVDRSGLSRSRSRCRRCD
jgi:hypothetical protein